eukprot:GHVT01074995.1.p1 GENE.GHVT01074995.1~~GHVT01074995.1.p1  ORF type:complete len:144 (-),score=46.54 GHVT01074995.1:384-815(-)
MASFLCSFFPFPSGRLPEGSSGLEVEEKNVRAFCRTSEPTKRAKPRGERPKANESSSTSSATSSSSSSATSSSSSSATNSSSSSATSSSSSSATNSSSSSTTSSSSSSSRRGSKSRSKSSSKRSSECEAGIETGEGVAASVLV